MIYLLTGRRAPPYCARNILDLSDAPFGDIIAFLRADESDSTVSQQVAKLGNGGMSCCSR